MGGMNEISTPGGPKSDERSLPRPVRAVRDAILGTDRAGAWPDLGYSQIGFQPIQANFG